MSALRYLASIQTLRYSIKIAPFVLEDGDDTAKAVLTLNLLDRPTSPEKMIAHFKGHSRHLLTFHGERNPSSGANCNGLMAILRAPEIDRYLKHIEHITDFLCDLFLSGPIQDKWVRVDPVLKINRLNLYRTVRHTTR